MSEPKHARGATYIEINYFDLVSDVETKLHQDNMSR